MPVIVTMPESAPDAFDFELVDAALLVADAAQDIKCSASPSICGSDFEEVKDPKQDKIVTLQPRIELNDKAKELSSELGDVHSATHRARVEAAHYRQKNDELEEEIALLRKDAAVQGEKDRTLRDLLEHLEIPDEVYRILLGIISRKRAEICVLGEDSPESFLTMESIDAVRELFPQWSQNKFYRKAYFEAYNELVKAQGLEEG